MAHFANFQSRPENPRVVQIYKPVGRPRARIFAFHGLDPTWRTTRSYWSQIDVPAPGASGPTPGDSTSPPNSVLLLRDFLLEKYPHCAIYSANHEDRWYIDDAVSAEYHIGGCILSHLKETPLEKRAPIVFIAHGLGGVYLKSVIQYLWGPNGKLTSHAPALDQLRGVIFLDTPHRYVDDPVDYMSFFPATVDLAFFKVKNAREWKAKVDSVTSEFRELVDAKSLTIYSVSEVPPSRWLKPDDTHLGAQHDREMIVEGNAAHFFPDLCAWLQQIFKGSLSRDPNWDFMVCSLRLEKPFRSFWLLNRDFLFNDHLEALTFNTFTGPGSSDVWVHLPVNDVRLMSAGMQRMTFSLPARTPETVGTIIEARSGLPHSRYVLPKHEFSQELVQSADGKKKSLTTQFHIVVPYLHWDTLAGAEAYNSDVRNAHSLGRNANLDTKIPGLGVILRNTQGNYHPRRTLDQFSFPRLKDTSNRDSDQVVSKQTKDQSLPGGPKMIMVDQLWLCLWIVEKAESDSEMYLESAILSSFPHTSYTRPTKDPPDPLNIYHSVDIQHSVLDKLSTLGTRSDDPFRAPKLAAFILSTALLGTLSTLKDPSLEFLELFREAIGDVTEKHNAFFRKFDQSMKTRAKRIHVDQRREEVQLGIEVADIIDELHMLRQLFETQRNVLMEGLNEICQAKHPTPWLESFRVEISDVSSKIAKDYLPQIERMIKDSERVQQSVLALLDLQQKEENLHEAQSLNQQAMFAAKQALAAQDQADATSTQSRLLFIFTLVNIVFLPLSFFTSYFSIYSVENGQVHNFARSFVHKFLGGASGAIIGGLLIAGGIWYYVTKLFSAKNRTGELIKLDDQGCLPPGLIDDSDPEWDRMEKMRAKRNARAKQKAGTTTDGAAGAASAGIERIASALGRTTTADETTRPVMVVEGALENNTRTTRRQRAKHGDCAV